MKKRYFLLPLVFISLILLVLDNNKTVVNKEITSDVVSINYPFFDIEIVDNYIKDYLNNYSDKEKVTIDYDYYNDEDIYYVTFYRNILDNNKVISGSDSFEIDVSSGNASKINKTNYEFDFVKYKNIDTNRKIVALTFDDGPNYNTNKILNILNKYNVPATFFVLGSKIKGNENTLKKMVDSGMEIGNHTFNHLLLTKYKESVIKREIEDTSKLIFEVTGKYPTLLRPSYGSSNKKVKKAAGMPIIIWDVDTLDWKNHSSKRIISRVMNKVKDGDIILMHDIYSATANAVDNIIPMLSSMGYSFVTVSDLFYYKEVPLEKGKVYGYAR